MSELLELGGTGTAPLVPGARRVSREAIGGQPGAVIWLIDCAAGADAMSLMAQLRQQPAPLDYLQPIVLLRVPDAAAPAALAADAVLPDAALAAAADTLPQRFADLQRWVEGLPEGRARDSQLSVRVLRHLASRGSVAEPLMSATHASGFLYPPLLPYFRGGGSGARETLQFLEEQHFLDGEFVTRAHFCFHCRSAFLCFEEVCIDCNSADLEIQELVHHFRCGHVAPLTEFGDGELLRCGKCGKELRHIGVDYDKPSLMYRCRSCDHRFQDASVRTTCFACSRQTAPENQRREVVARYSLTPLGENAAHFGVESLFSHLLERDVGLVPWSVFQRLVSLEQARIERYGKSASTLMLLGIRDMEAVYRQLGARARGVFQQLSDVLGAVLRDTDVATSREGSFYLFLLTETELASAERPRQRLLQRLEDVLSANLEEVPSLELRLRAVDASLDLDAQLQALVEPDRD